jgi:hypothetical protein
VFGTGAAIPTASSAAAATVPASGTTPPGQPGARKWEGAIGIAEAAEKAGRWVNRETPPLTTVTDAMLRNPPAADWLNWRRTLDGHGYSPLAGIDRGNVGHLKLAWTLTMHEGSNQGTPLIHDGVMFLTHPGNVIQALDAASGDLLWEYTYPYPTESRTLGGPTRNIAIYGDKLYLATYDAAIVAIDARTGREVWRTVKADFAKGYTHTAGPVIADGVVVSGINGCERFKKEGCFITGHDPDTGRELWRTSTIALPGDPNNATWLNNSWNAQVGGTDVWGGDGLHYTQNSPYVAVCLAAYMGAVRIGLTGVDLTDHHFFAPTGRHPLAGRLKELDAQYGRLAAALAQRGVELVNLSAASRLSSLPKADLSRLARMEAEAPRRGARQSGLRIVSYATTPVAGVPAILARCIAAATEHEARCVWAGDSYGNGVRFAGDVQWKQQPNEASRLLEAADLVIVHNGKVDPAHGRLLQNKPVVTMAHNYGWNVDMQFVRRGAPAVVVGQYQATLPEFAGWTVVPNPVPLWEPNYSPGEKGRSVAIAFTPSGRHERYPPGHKLYWHGKGYDTTMRVLERLARRSDVRTETTAQGQVSHAEALAMKRRAHIVIDECVTGSYHRNSLEALAAGCVVVNGVGLLPGVAEILQRCAPTADRVPFIFSTLETLEKRLLELIELGPDALAEQGRRNRRWMEAHWNFATQWTLFWSAVSEPRPRALTSVQTASAPAHHDCEVRPKGKVMKPFDIEPVSVIIPHGGAERLPHLAASLAILRQRTGIREIIVAEMGAAPVARELCGRWADKHLFIGHDGPFERARALNAAQALAECSLLLWHDNDLLMPSDFVPRAVQELRERGLDYLIPYTSVRYLSQADSRRVMQGERDPSPCAPERMLYSANGGMGLVRREFLAQHGGLIEGFRGWGGEDNAWYHKVTLLGRASRTQRKDQHVHHLHHPGIHQSQRGPAANANPFYPENVALLIRVCAIRNAAEFSRLFPPAPCTSGELSRFPPQSTSGSGALTVWTYWEGPRPDWIRACLRTIAASAPNVRLLTPESFDRLRDRDRDVDLSRLHAPHRADYIRAFLLQRFGGLWIDADCLVMQPLQPVLELLAKHDFVGHRERAGLISNAFIAARPGSRIAAAFYERVCRLLRARRPLGWNAIGAEPLSAIVAEDASGWHELPCERVQPICWSQPEKFFEQRTPVEHEQVFDTRAMCYMLSNGAIKNYLAKHPGAELMNSASFFSFLLGRTPAGAEEHAPGPYEELFSAHADLYRRHRDESLSGPGSSREQTKELRERLPLALEALDVRSLLDAPCGDLNWMQHVRLGVERYVGVDVLTEIIADNKGRHASGQRSFLRADLTRDPLPRADAILCRDFLTHLSFADIFAVLDNFKRSGATYVLTTTFTGQRPNRDTSGGQWRTLNLGSAPFNFPPPRLLLNERCTEGGGSFADKSLGVWVLSELPADVCGNRSYAQGRTLQPSEALPV